MTHRPVQTARRRAELLLPRKRRSREEVIGDLRWAYGYAKACVPLYAGAGTVIYVLAIIKGETPLYSLPMLLAFYVIAGAAAATIVGLMRPMAIRSLRGAMFVGWLATLPVYLGGAVAFLGRKALADVGGATGLLVVASAMGIIYGRIAFKD